MNTFRTADPMPSLSSPDTKKEGRIEMKNDVPKRSAHIRSIFGGGWKGTFIACIVTFLTALAVHADTTTLTATADTWLAQTSPTTNTGANVGLDVGYGGGGWNETLVKFSFSSLPSGAQISSATLSLYALSNAASFSLKVYQVTSSWNEVNPNGATWNYRPSSSSTVSASKTFSPSGSAQTWTIDITSLVQGWVQSGNANYGLLLAAGNSAEAAFWSRESSSVSQRPQLTVTYTVLPDLTVDTLTVNGSSSGVTVPAGSTVSVNWHLTKTPSGAAASNFNHGIYWSTNTTITTSDQLLLENGPSTMAVGTTGMGRSSPQNVTIPSGATPGTTYYLGYIVDSGNVVTESNDGNNTRYVAITVQPTVDITVQTNPSGGAVTVDGTVYASPHTFSSTPGSNHSITTDSPQGGNGLNTQWVWDNWSDGGALSHTITTPSSARTYTANFKQQYWLGTSQGTGGNGVSPQGGWQDSGAVVPISAEATQGYIFSNWTGSGSGSYSGNSNPASVTMNGPITETAHFIVSTYAVSYNANGATSGTAPASQIKIQDVTLTLASNSGNLAKTGYTFAGWNTAANGSGTDYAAGGNYTANAAVTLYAKWTPVTYTVAYNGNGNTGGSTTSSSHTYDVSKSLTANGFTRTSYTFAGWATSAGGAVVYSDAQSVVNLASTQGATVTLYAKWTATGQIIATHSSAGYQAGGSCTVQCQVVYTVKPDSMTWQATLPVGWSYASDTSTAGTKPTVGATGTVAWVWTSVPASPVTFSFTMNVPAGESGSKNLAASVIAFTGDVLSQPPATPNPLVINPVSQYHSADYNHDGKIDDTEITRAISIYTKMNGTVRTGDYYEKSGTVDGYSTTPGTRLGNCHSADYNNNWQIDDIEITRLISLYTYMNGSVRTGEYHAQAGTVDGFSRGPAVVFLAAGLSQELTAIGGDAVLTSTIAGTHSAGNYQAGGTCTVACQLQYTVTPDAMTWQATLPAGWSYASDTSTAGTKPAVGATGTVAWVWTSVPASPVTFSFTVNVPAGESGLKNLTANVIAFTGDVLDEPAATPDPLVIGDGTNSNIVATHSAGNYQAGGTCTVACQLQYTVTPDAMTWQATLPAGWSYASDTSTAGTKPTVGATGTVAWVWTSVPASPVTFSFTVNVPAGESGLKNLTAKVIAFTGDVLDQPAATPDPLVIGDGSGKQGQTITFPALPAKTYGDADFAPGATASSGLAVTYTSDNLAVATIVSGEIHIKGVGPTTITATQAGDTNWNEATPVQQALTVTKKALTVTADSKSRLYGAANPVFTLSYIGFVNGDGPSDLDITPTANCVATAASPAETYPIALTGGGDNCYTLALIDGTLTVTPLQVVPTVTTTPPSGITATGANSGGNVTSAGGGTVTARGVCWSTAVNPTTANSTTTDGTGTGSFTSNLAGLTPNTTYYICAYATNSAGTAYGGQCTFTTLLPSNGPDFVIADIAITPELPAVGGRFTATVTVLNQGNQSGKAGYLYVWVDKPEAAAVGERGSKSASIGTLKPGQSKTLRVSLTAPNEWNSFTLRAFVDAKNMTREADESNNQGTYDYDTGLPDFEVLDVWLSPEIPIIGKTFTAYVTVSNSGEVAGNAGYLDVWADSSTLEALPVPGSRTKGNKYKAIGTLQPGQEKTVTVTGLKAPTDNEWPVLGLLIDSRGKTLEMDEDNNWFEFEYECQ